MSRFSVRFVLLISLMIILASISFAAFVVQRVEASGTIYIRVNGLIEGTDKITRTDNVTYTFTDNINDSIVIERNNIIIDGNGYKLQGTYTPGSKGISISAINNVTVKNINIENFESGIYCISTSLNVISGNNITGSTGNGIKLDYPSSNNSISGNRIENNTEGISLEYSSNNIITGNSIENNNDCGMYIWGAHNNTIIGNNITGSKSDGIWLFNDVVEPPNNRIYHNNFVDNTIQALSASYGPLPRVNIWDDGFPSGGNYWSNYNGTDSDNDGIGKEEYDIYGENNTDHYPLMGMFSSVNTSYGYAVSFVSNSSISNVSFDPSYSEAHPEEAMLAFNVSGGIYTDGFLRICIPKILINGSYVIRFDGDIVTNSTYPQVRELPYSNETYEYLYINYTHSEHTIMITGTTMIPEFPSFLILPLFMIATLLAAIVYKRKSAHVWQDMPDGKF